MAAVADVAATAADKAADVLQLWLQMTAAVAAVVALAVAADVAALASTASVAAVATASGHQGTFAARILAVAASPLVPGLWSSLKLLASSLLLALGMFPLAAAVVDPVVAALL